MFYHIRLLCRHHLCFSIACFALLTATCIAVDDAAGIDPETLQAAEQGHADAQYNLGVAYNFGNGVIKDYETSYMHLLLAAAPGNQQAAEFGDKIELKLTPEAISRAQKAASAMLEAIKARQNAE